MPSVMAIVSKAVFEKEARGLALGDVWETARYASRNKGLTPLAESGNLYLVTVRPPEQLWLVACLVMPHFSNGEWHAAVNTLPARSLEGVRGEIELVSGTGITAKPGALGMSLQTPRVLTDKDVGLLDAQPVHARRSVPEPTGSAARAQATPLDEAAASLHAGELGAALDHALAAWRATAAVEVAELVDAISARVTAELPAVDDWIEVARQRRAIDLGRLLAVLDRPPLGAIRERFEMLGAFAPDPRLAPAMLPIPGEYSYEAGPCFKVVFDLVETSRDPRARQLLGGVIAQLTPKPGASKAWRGYLEKHTRRAEKLRATLPAEVEVPAAMAKKIAACLVALRWAKTKKLSTTAVLAPRAHAGEVDQLLAAIYAQPEDDHARAVYADVLQQRGDPRGEFIALQLSGKKRSRERELLKHYQRAWLVPFDHALSSPRFARGFLDAATLEWAFDNERAELLDHPMLSTITELDTADQGLLLRPHLRALRRATVEPATLSELAKREHAVPLEAAIGRLEMRYGIRARVGIPLATEAAWGAALEVGALANLRSISIGQANAVPAQMRWLLDSKLGEQLTELDLQCFRTRFVVKPWLAALRDGLIIRGTFSNANTASGQANPAMSIELSRTGNTLTAMLDCNNDFVDVRHMSIGVQVRASLEGLAGDSIAATVRYVGSKKRGKPGFPAIVATLRAAFPDLTLL